MTPIAKDAKAGGGASRCPVCGQPAHSDFAPFCSTRCADVDLGRWLNESYVIPGPEPEESGPAQPDATDRSV